MGNLTENSNTQIEVKYQDLDTTLSFSMLSSIIPSDGAFEVFVTEMSAAFSLLRQLRALSREDMAYDERREIDKLFYQVVNVLEDCYRLNRGYSIECAGAKHNGDVEGIENFEIKVEFEETCGPFVRELGAPVASLKGFSTLFYEYSLSEDKRQEFLEIVDKTIATVLEILDDYSKHLSGEINLWEENAIQDS